MRTSNATCDVCGKKFYLRPSRKKESVSGRFGCSKKCSNVLKSNFALGKLEKRLGILNLESWLKEKYLEEMMSTREISLLMYGTNENSKSVLSYLKRFGIPIRRGSEAVKTQWINNDERRKNTSEMAVKNFGTNSKGRQNLKNIMQTEEYRNKASIVKKGQNNPMYNVVRDESPHWNPSKTDEERIKQRKTFRDARWRRAVLERDNNTCRKCGSPGNFAHHMNGYDEFEDERYDAGNGLTLCEGCHKLYHHKFGKYSTKEKTMKFLKQSIQ